MPPMASPFPRSCPATARLGPRAPVVAVALLCASAVLRAAAAAQCPVAFWSFDPDVLYDQSNAYNLTPASGTATQVPGIVGNALASANGAEAVLGTVASRDVQVGSFSFSIMLWAKIPPTAASLDIAETPGRGWKAAGFVMKYNYVGFTGMQIWLCGNSKGCLYMGTCNNTADNQWHHYAATLNTLTGMGVFYLDGVAQPSSCSDCFRTKTGRPCVTGWGPRGNCDFSELLADDVFREGVGFAQKVGPQVVDEVMLFHRVLPPEEIAQAANPSTAASYAALCTSLPTTCYEPPATAGALPPVLASATFTGGGRVVVRVNAPQYTIETTWNALTACQGGIVVRRPSDGVAIAQVALVVSYNESSGAPFSVQLPFAFTFATTVTATAPLAAVALAPAAAVQCPTAFWSFDPDVLYDQSNAYNLTPASGTATQVPGVVGNALASAKGTAAVLGTAPSRDVQVCRSSFSIMLWAKIPPTQAELEVALNQDKGWNKAGFDVRYNYIGIKGMQLELCGNNKGCLYIGACHNTSDNQWHHYAATLNSLTGMGVFYLDGVAQPSSCSDCFRRNAGWPCVTGWGPGGIGDFSELLVDDVSRSRAGLQLMVGPQVVDEVMLFHRVLPPEEIAQAANPSTAASYAALCTALPTPCYEPPSTAGALPPVLASAAFTGGGRVVYTIEANWTVLTACEGGIVCPAAFWSFDPDVLYDQSNAHNLTPASGTSTQVPGVVGTALASAIGTAAVLGTAPSRDVQVGTSSFSIMLWVKIPPTQAQFDVAVNPDIGGNKAGFGLRYNYTGIKGMQLKLCGNNKGCLYIGACHNTSDNQWHHYAVTLNNITSMGVFYLDGVAQPSSCSRCMRKNGIGPCVTDWGPRGKCDFSELLSDDVSRSWVGLQLMVGPQVVDEVMLFHRVLPPEEIAQAANLSTAASYAAPCTSLPTTCYEPPATAGALPPVLASAAFTGGGRVVVRVNAPQYTIDTTWTALTACEGGIVVRRPSEAIAKVALVVSYNESSGASVSAQLPFALTFATTVTASAPLAAVALAPGAPIGSSDYVQAMAFSVLYSDARLSVPCMLFEPGSKVYMATTIDSPLLAVSQTSLLRVTARGLALSANDGVDLTTKVAVDLTGTNIPVHEL
eukprot:m51a1_g3076 hypothetical protein (1127) ;mRNA; f:37074-45198